MYTFSMMKKYLLFCILHIQTAFIPAFGESRIKPISADYMPEHDNNYEEMNSVGIYQESSFLECAMKCSSDKRCLSFFYNNLTGVCIPHQDPFTYTVMSLRENGWKIYLTRDPHIGLVYDASICIQGKNTGAGWMYNDGSPIRLNRWLQDEPNGLLNVIMMFRFAHNGWTVPKNDSVCSYICEY